MSDNNKGLYAKRSQIWMHFSPVVGKPNKAKCDTCGHEYSYSNGSTSNLALHIRTKHPSLANVSIYWIPNYQSLSQPNKRSHIRLRLMPILVMAFYVTVRTKKQDKSIHPTSWYSADCCMPIWSRTNDWKLINVQK